MADKPITGIAWYNESDWEEWKRISGDEFEDTYEEWVTEALKAKRELERQRMSIKQVLITPANYKAWCVKNNKEYNGGSRSEYVSELLSIVHSDD